MSPIDGSIEGGTVIAFEGNGFGCKDIAVKIGSSDCIVNTNALTNFLVMTCFNLWKIHDLAMSIIKLIYRVSCPSLRFVHYQLAQCHRALIYQ